MVIGSEGYVNSWLEGKVGEIEVEVEKICSKGGRSPHTKERGGIGCQMCLEPTSK